jgi:peptide/nickel transport system ATP-binding protein
MNEMLLNVQNLKTYFPVAGGIFRRTIGYVHAVDDVSLHIKKAPWDEAY